MSMEPNLDFTKTIPNVPSQQENFFAYFANTKFKFLPHKM